MLNTIVDLVVENTVLDMARRINELIANGFDYDDRQRQYRKDFQYMMWDSAFYQADLEKMLILYTEKVCPIFR